MDKNEQKRKIEEEEDYIRSPKYNNSIKRFMSRNIAEASDAEIAKLLLLTEEEVVSIYEEAIELLRNKMEIE